MLWQKIYIYAIDFTVYLSIIIAKIKTNSNYLIRKLNQKIMFFYRSQKIDKLNDNNNTLCKNCFISINRNYRNKINSMYGNKFDILNIDDREYLIVTKTI